MAGFSIGNLPGFSFGSSGSTLGSKPSNSSPAITPVAKNTNSSSATSVSFSGESLGRVVDAFARDGRGAGAASAASSSGNSVRGNEGDSSGNNVTFRALQERREFISGAQSSGLGDILENRRTDPQLASFESEQNPVEVDTSRDNINNRSAAQLERAENKVKGTPERQSSRAKGFQAVQARQAQELTTRDIKSEQKPRGFQPASQGVSPVPQQQTEIVETEADINIRDAATSAVFSPQAQVEDKIQIIERAQPASEPEPEQVVETNEAVVVAASTEAGLSEEVRPVESDNSNQAATKDTVKEASNPTNIVGKLNTIA